MSILNKPRSPLRAVRAAASLFASLFASLLVGLFVGLFASAWAQSPADVASGRQKAQACAVCHGPLGISVSPDAPNLAGQSAIYTAAQLRAYRSGARKHEVMGYLAKPLSDDDINHLAAWFSVIKIEAHAPP
jgi:cytochrome c553